MKRTLSALVLLIVAASLAACAGRTAAPPRDKPALVTASHSVYLEGGVLKVFSHEDRNLLYVYVRPRVSNRWIASGGGGGNQADPWQFTASMSWALGDEHGTVHSDAARRTFSCLFDSQHMTLNLESGTYAVRAGDFVVIALDENWRPDTVESGIEALRIFDLPEDRRTQLMSRARAYHGS